MATSNGHDPFKGKPKSGEGNGGPREIPSENKHEARVVGLIDLGTHLDGFQGEAKKPTRKVMLAFELDEQDSQRQNHIVLKEYRLSFHEKSSLRLLAEDILCDGKNFPPEKDIDYKELLGQPCQVHIIHETPGERTYAKTKAVDGLPRKIRDQVFRPTRKPFAWFLGGDLKSLPGWLPYWYGKPLSQIIEDSQEMRGGVPAESSDEGEVGAGVGADDEDTPF